MLSDDEALTPAEDCYQRLLRSGEHDEMELVDNYLKTNSMSALFDSVLIPVVAAAGTDRSLGFLDDGQLESVERDMSEIVDAVSPDYPAEAQGSFNVCCVPARAHRDQLAGEMLMRLLWNEGVSTQSAMARMPLGELVAWVRKANADVICISVVAPSTLIHARYLCTKFRAVLPALKIVVGLWGRQDLTPDHYAALRQSGANEIFTSLVDALAHLCPQTSEKIPVPPDQMIDGFPPSDSPAMPDGLP